MKKSTGEHNLPANLAKCAACYICKSLNLIINQTQKTSSFLNNAERAAVTLLDKGSLDKDDVNNFWPVSILNYSSEIFENFMKRSTFLLKIIYLFSYLHIEHL